MMTANRVAAFAALLSLGGPLATVHAASYRIDAKDASASFEARFLGLLPVRGEFRRTTGTLIYDRETRQGSIEVFIDTTTVESSAPTVQDTARGPGFFNADKFPSIDFRSSRFVFDGAGLKSVEGTLTVLGLAQPVVLQVSESHCEPAVAAEAAFCRAAAELVIRRSAFGMQAWAKTLSDNVTIHVAIVAREVPTAPAPPAADVVSQP